MSVDVNSLPRAFGPYTLLERIAVGGMAEVYVAKAQGVSGFEKLVAIKVIHPRLSEDEHFVRMLVEEAKISVLLTHGNIAQTFDLGCIEDTYFIVLEYIEGVDGYRLLRRAAELRRALPFEVCAYICAEICNGLEYAHKKRDSKGQPLNIVHRDVSPQNVLLSYSGEVKLVDFGIAKATLRDHQTAAGVIKGKYYYMSPEQAWGDPMDHRSDIFSTGIVLYELLTGRMLYAEDNVPALLEKVRKAEIARPETRRPNLPQELSDIVMKALARPVEDRYATAREMGEALTTFLYRSFPSFSASKLSETMSSIFPEAERPQHGLDAPSKPARPPTQPPSTGTLPPMKPGEFAVDHRKSVIYHDPAKSKTPQSIDKAVRTQDGVGPPAPFSPSTQTNSGVPGAIKLPPAPRSTAVLQQPSRVPSPRSIAPRMNMPRPSTVPRPQPGLESTEPRVQAPLEPPALAAAEPLDDERTLPPKAPGAAEPPSVPPLSSLDEPEHTMLDAAQLRDAALGALLESERPTGPAPKSGHEGPVSSMRVEPRSVEQRASSKAAPQRPKSMPAPPKSVPAPSKSTPASAPDSLARTADVASPAREGAHSDAPTPVPPPNSARGFGVAPPALEGAGNSTRASANFDPFAILADIDPPETNEGVAPLVEDPFAPTRAQELPSALSEEVRAARRRRQKTLVPLLLVPLALVSYWYYREQLPAPISLDVVTTPENAAVTVNGQPLSAPRHMENLAPGTVHIEAAHPGYQSASVDVDLQPGANQRLLVLSPLPATLAVVTTPPAAAITVNGAERGESPLQLEGFQFGQDVEVRAQLEGYDIAVTQVHVDEATESVTLELVRSQR